ARRDSAARDKLLDVVEKAVKAAKGMSASEVAKATSTPQARVSTALRELKLAKRIFQGGDRRFARYAGDTKTAVTASETARKTAAGPLGAGKARKG
ncbi:MAG: hypothetical protein HY908_11105, partial [Myxococcales bacterium]|nr:hypothetical protein [Myxococcales bacterium]